MPGFSAESKSEVRQGQWTPRPCASHYVMARRRNKSTKSHVTGRAGGGWGVGTYTVTAQSVVPEACSSGAVG